MEIDEPVLRLADLVAGLSRIADLGFGLQPGESLRAAALALLLGDSLDLADEDRRAAMYSALLLHLGCVGYSHETAGLFGDELSMNAAVARTNVADSKDVVATFVPGLVRGHPPLTKVRLALVALTRGRRFGLAYETTACEVGRQAARRLHLPPEVERSVYHSYERWQGGGVPSGIRGDDIPLGARVAVLSTVAVLFETTGGAALSAHAVRQQAGTMLDPAVADQFCRRADALLGELGAGDPRRLVLDAEPAPVMTVAESRLAEVASVFGDVVDLKTPFLHGHARGVAALARRAGERLGLAAPACAELEVAGLLHDVGRVAVPNAVWEKPGPLGGHEWEQVRLHAYHGERILTGSERLARLAGLVGMHHERLDGSGYHRSCRAGDLSAEARILAAADTYHAMGQHRPHRPAKTDEQIERCLLDEVRDGRLDADAVNAVLAVAGHQAVATPVRPAGLTEREVEVLALVAEGLSNAQIAERLVIARRTAEHHVQHIYTRIGVSSRAAAALFAIEHDLVRRPDG